MVITIMARRSPDTLFVLISLLAILAISLILQQEINLQKSLLFLIGIGLGFSLLHAAFGFTGGWRQLIRDGRSAGARAQLLLIFLSCLLFFPILGKAFPAIQAAGASGQIGFSLLIGAFLFGIGMQLGGGCGSGTLFTVGGGHVKMLLTLVFFIVGATIGSAHLDWWLALPNKGTISLIQEFGWPLALFFTIDALIILYIIVSFIELKRHGKISSIKQPHDATPFIDRLLFGPWPLWWGAVGLTVFGLLTLLVAKHTWSITFAFGLWGAKFWAAIGGDPASWSFWSDGYAATALNSSVLSDNTSIMNFGIILGAVLAASLAGKFAPTDKVRRIDIVTAILGGLLLGYGARLAFGCNIGALLAGIASGSLHGWLWLAAGFIGNIVGVYLRNLWHMDTVKTT